MVQLVKVTKKKSIFFPFVHPLSLRSPASEEERREAVARFCFSSVFRSSFSPPSCPSLFFPLLTQTEGITASPSRVASGALAQHRGRERAGKASAPDLIEKGSVEQQSLSLSLLFFSFQKRDVQPRPGLLHRGALPLGHRGRRREGPLGVCGRGRGRVSGCFFVRIDFVDSAIQAFEPFCFLFLFLFDLSLLLTVFFFFFFFFCFFFF